MATSDQEKASYQIRAVGSITIQLCAAGAGHRGRGGFTPKAILPFQFFFNIQTVRTQGLQGSSIADYPYQHGFQLTTISTNINTIGFRPNHHQFYQSSTFPTRAIPYGARGFNSTSNLHCLYVKGAGRGL